MILTRDFINQALKQIKDGIDKFNKDSEYKAFMPEEVEFDLAIIAIDDIQYVCSEMDNNKNVSRIKVIIQTAHYPWLKE